MDLQITQPFISNVSTRMRKARILVTQGLAPQGQIPEWKIFWCMDFPCLIFVFNKILLQIRFIFLSRQNIQQIEKGPT